MCSVDQRSFGTGHLPDDRHPALRTPSVFAEPDSRPTAYLARRRWRGGGPNRDDPSARRPDVPLGLSPITVPDSLEYARGILAGVNTSALNPPHWKKSPAAVMNVEESNVNACVRNRPRFQSSIHHEAASHGVNGVAEQAPQLNKSPVQKRVPRPRCNIMGSTRRGVDDFSRDANLHPVCYEDVGEVGGPGSEKGATETGADFLRHDGHRPTWTVKNKTHLRTTTSMIDSLSANLWTHYPRRNASSVTKTDVDPFDPQISVRMQYDLEAIRINAVWKYSRHGDEKIEMWKGGAAPRGPATMYLKGECEVEGRRCGDDGEGALARTKSRGGGKVSAGVEAARGTGSNERRVAFLERWGKEWADMEVAEAEAEADVEAEATEGGSESGNKRRRGFSHERQKPEREGGVAGILKFLLYHSLRGDDGLEHVSYLSPVARSMYLSDRTAECSRLQFRLGGVTVTVSNG
ncbi:hypothetical protein DFH06DRAFT_1131896 [Mycena polygramma]|nr:hypothetical protein DFH06DRAFT_1131896 [Mycena polygramma]